MKINLLYLLPLFAFTCNKIAPKQYITSSNCSIISNDAAAANLITKYTGIGKADSLKYVINIQSDTSSGYTISKVGDTISIKGNTLQAAVYFLDKYCGVRFYMPTDLWASKAKDTIYIDSVINYTHTSYTPVIFSTGFKSAPEDYWQLYNNLGNNSFGVTQHSMSQRFYDSTMFKLFPNVYDNGYPQSYNDPNFEPDFTKSDIVAASMYSARKFFVNYPFNYISFSVMDSYNGYPKPIAGQTLTQTFVKYINALADSFAIVFPNKKITYLVYGSVHDFPTERLRDNVIPITVMKPASAILNGMLDAESAKQLGKFMPNFGNHDWAEGYGFVVPRIYSSLLQQVFNVLNYGGIRLQFAHLECYPNWSLDGPKLYEMAKIYDNPAVNIDSVRTLFCLDMFGIGWPYMKSYFDDLEALSTSMNNNPLIARSLGYYPSQLKLDVQDSTLASNARGYINQALKVTTGTEHQRVQFFSNGFRISESLWSIYKKNADSTFIPFLKDSIAGNQMYLNIATDPDFMSTMTNLINSIK